MINKKGELDVEVIKRLSKNEMDDAECEILFTAAQKSQKLFIKNMLKNNIPLHALVSGFRGTGKSSFVKYIFSDYENNKDVIVVKFNTTQYTTYEHFLRKITRELYLACEKKWTIDSLNGEKQTNQVEDFLKEYDGLKKLYLSTFYEMKDFTDYEENSTFETKKLSQKEFKLIG